jgi:RIO kinase 1
MPKLNPNLFLDEDYEVYGDRQAHRVSKPKPGAHTRRPPVQVLEEMAIQSDGVESFRFTYQASRHEQGWLLDSLGDFYEGQWLHDVLRMIRGGKEASVYQCTGAVMASSEPYLAAKVYRPRPLRSLKNDHLYREGRANLDSDGNQIRNHGMVYAMHKRTDFGLQLLHTSWIEHEFQALQTLHAAGADVPFPYARGANAVLMSYIGGPETPAPTLQSVDLDPEEVRPIFERVLKNIEIMLSKERVHGDLSAYNILYWEGEITLIDFPQAINPYENRNAYRIFERDVTRICEYFTLQGVGVNPKALAADLWTAHRYRLTPDVHPRLLDDQDEADRAYWQHLQE